MLRQKVNTLNMDLYSYQTLEGEVSYGRSYGSDGGRGFRGPRGPKPLEAGVTEVSKQVSVSQEFRVL